MINRQFFFDYARQHLFNGSLKGGPTAGLTAILDYWESNSSKKDDRWLADAPPTAHHETHRTFRGIEEYGKGRGTYDRSRGARSRAHQRASGHTSRSEEHTSQLPSPHHL